MARRKRADKVGTEEVKDALLRALVENFDGRPIDIDTVEWGFRFALFEIKQAAVFAPRVTR